MRETNWLDRIIRAGPAPLLWLALIIGVVYFRTLGFGFTALDDEHLVLENRKNLSSWANLPQAFRTDVYWRDTGSYYRPVLNLSLMADQALGKDSIRAHHLGNLLLHILACWMAYFCLRAWGAGRGLAVAFSTMFAVHPALAQAVAWIPGRNDILLALFLLGSFLGLIKYLGGASPAWLGLHLAGLALALFSKETALLAPLVFVAYYWKMSRRPDRARLLYPALGWTLIIVPWSFLRTAALGGERALAWPRFIGWTEAGIGLLSYLGKVTLPLNLSVLPLAKDINLVFGIIGAAILAGLACAGGLGDRKAFWFGLAWFLLFLVPTFIPSSDSMNFLEHRLYLPLFGILLVMGQSKLVKKVPPRAGAAMALVIAAAWGMISFRHQTALADGVSFWSNAVRTSPRSGLAHQMLGRQYFREGRTDEAIKRYLHSLSLEESPSAHNDLALAWMKKGAPDSAEVHFRRVLETDSNLANVHNNLALVYFQQGQWEPARRHLAQAERLSAGDSDPLLNTGVLMLELGRPDSAVLYLRRALALDPHNPEALLNLGVALSRQGRGEQALAQLLAAHRLCPGHPLINLRLAQLYLLSGRREEALAHYRAARQAGGPVDFRLEK